MSKIKPDSPPDNTKDRRTYRQRIEDAFPALCVARAWHWSQGEETLQDAVDWLQNWADTRGLVGFIGQDNVQAIMAAAWAPWRTELQGIPPQPIPATPVTPVTPDPLPPASTIDAAEYLVKQGDLQRLKNWMSEHSLEIQAAIVKHLENKRRPA